LPGRAIDGRPARPLDLITAAAPVVAARWLYPLAVQNAARGRLDTPGRVGGGLGKCRAACSALMASSWRRRACRCAACQRRSCRRHSGSWQ